MSILQKYRCKKIQHSFVTGNTGVGIRCVNNLIRTHDAKEKQYSHACCVDSMEKNSLRRFPLLSDASYVLSKTSDRKNLWYQLLYSLRRFNIQGCGKGPLLVITKMNYSAKSSSSSSSSSSALDVWLVIRSRVTGQNF